MDADRSLHVSTSTDSTIAQGSHVSSGFIDYHASSNCYQGTHGGPFVADSSLGFLPNGICSQLWPNEEMINNIKAENVEFSADIACMSNGMPSSTNGLMSFQDSQIMLADSGYPLFHSGKVIFDDMSSLPLSACASYMSYGDHYQNNFHSENAEFNVGQDVKQTPDIFCPVGGQAYKYFKNDNSYAVIKSETANQYQDSIGANASFQGNMDNLNLKAVGISWSQAQALSTTQKQFSHVKREKGGLAQHELIDSHLSKGRTENFLVDQGPDVCIIEDISHPAPKIQSANIGNSLNISQCSRYVDSQSSMVGSTRLKACDERNILRVALQVCSLFYGSSPS